MGNELAQRRGTSDVAGPQKAAILLVQLPRDSVARVLRDLDEVEVFELMTEVARLRTVDQHVVGEVVEEFVSMAGGPDAVGGGLDVARALLEQSLGHDRAADILDRVTAGRTRIPFGFLRGADPRQVLSFLRDEHPQTIALVLAHLPSQQSATILSGLDDDLQRDVAHRLAVMDRTAPDVLDHVEAVLGQKVAQIVQPNTDSMPTAGGVQGLVDILTRSDRATERQILHALEAANPELAEEVRQRMFVFEDIVTLDDRSVQLVLRQVDSKELAIALKGVRPDVKEKILRNLSERAAANLDEEISLLGPVRLKSVEEAQGAIVRVIRRLEEEGTIVMARGGDEFVE